MINGMQVIALEEHYYDKELAATFGGGGGGPKTIEKMYDHENMRLDLMDKAGVDMHIFSHAAPSGQRLTEPGSTELIKRINDRLAELCARHPTRFGGFAALASNFPDEAADELERCVKDLGFVGAMVHGPSGGLFMDDKKFRPIFARAEALDVPIYMHPGSPMPAVIDAYYKEYVQEYPSILSAGWGFTVETATAAVRMILSGIFREHPNLKIILGHLGEGIPFLLDRINESFSRPGGEPVNFRKTFCNNFWVTTSGFFSSPALLCTQQELGIDRIMYSVDWPYVEFDRGSEWLKTLQMNPNDLSNLLAGNAKRLLKL